MVNYCSNFILHLLYPGHCALCGAPGEDQLDICPGCLGDLPRNRHPCPRCALPLPPDSGVNRICGHCIRHPPAVDHSLAPLLYQPPVSRLIKQFKFDARLEMAGLLGGLFAASVDATGELPELIIPVPLHPARTRERGFNQALELARVIGRQLNIPINRHCCGRTRHTATQLSFKREERRRNLRGAFSVDQPPRGRHLALLDDVITTGSTMDELARTLKAAGAERVDAWAIARTP